MKRVRHLLAQFLIKPLHRSKSAAEIKAGPKYLQPQVVLFVDHHPGFLGDQHGSPTPRFAGCVQPGQILAHQMPLVQYLTLGQGQLVHPHEHAVRQTAHLRHRITHLL